MKDSKLKCALLISIMLIGSAYTAQAEEQTYGLSMEQYEKYSVQRSSVVNMIPLTIWYGEDRINCDVFYSKEKIYVPLRNVAEMLGRTVIYDGGKNIISIIGTETENKADVIRFGARDVTINQNKTPVYLGDKEITALKNSEYFESGFNCEGTLYIRLKDLTDAIGYYSYYDENMQLHISDVSERLKMLPIKEGTEVYEEYMEYKGNLPYEESLELNIHRPIFSRELMTEAERRAWNYYSQPHHYDDTSSWTFSYKGKDYIDVTVGMDQLDISFGKAIIFEVLPEEEIQSK